MCEIDSWWEPALQHSWLSLVLCEDLEEWDRGREVQEGGHMCLLVAVGTYLLFTVWQKLTQHCKAIIRQQKSQKPNQNKDYPWMCFSPLLGMGVEGSVFY